MLSDVAIRPISESDAPAIYTVALEAWRHTYHTIFDGQFIESFVNRYYAPEATLSLFPRIRSGSMFFHVAEYQSKVIGFCNIGINNQSAELYRIYLLPAFTGQGIGQRLLSLGEDLSPWRHATPGRWGDRLRHAPRQRTLVWSQPDQSLRPVPGLRFWDSARWNRSTLRSQDKAYSL